MAVVESLEGSVGGLWFHYDLRNDVLYLRRTERRDDEVYGEETSEGFILLRAIADDSTIGMTVVNWWKRFGQGALPDSMNQVIARIEPWAKRSGVERVGQVAMPALAGCPKARSRRLSSTFM